jgi:hypothetical protein
MTVIKFKTRNFDVWTLSGIGQYLTIFTGKIVDFLGSELQRFGPCHVFFIRRRSTNYLKVCNGVDKNKSRWFYSQAKLTYFWENGAYLAIFSTNKLCSCVISKIHFLQDLLTKLYKILGQDLVQLCGTYSQTSQKTPPRKFLKGSCKEKFLH